MTLILETLKQRMKTPPKPIMLIILDGFGSSTSPEANAILSANTPFWDQLLKDYPSTLLTTSGIDVGLPEGQMGNSEVGHLTMGAGRVIFQDLPRISLAIQNKSFFQNPVWLENLNPLKNTQKKLHILGLLSPGGVHSHEDHIFALIELAANLGVSTVVHAILDGRDTPPRSAKASIEKLAAICHQVKQRYPGIESSIGSISGRFYAMDRDKRWERTKQYYDLLTEGLSEYHFQSATQALEAAYERGENDEFVQPSIIYADNQEIDHHIHDGDVIAFMNFRADRARQISYALTQDDFPFFERQIRPKLSAFITLTNYASDLAAKIVFPLQNCHNTLGEYLATHHKQQLRAAETEKYAHVTYFFNGGREAPFTGENRTLIPSPKVHTYDLCPEMSAEALTAALVDAINSQQYDLIICNYANADMVGHTGNFPATVKAIEVLDVCLKQLIEALQRVGGEACITADHGNAELMSDPITHQPHTAHTNLPVPFVYVGKSAQMVAKSGTLADVAPTLLTLLHLDIPSEMTGHSLLKNIRI